LRTREDNRLGLIRPEVNLDAGLNILPALNSVSTPALFPHSVDFEPGLRAVGPTLELLFES